MAKRVHIMGPPGSGKSTAAAHLARALGVPHIELDALFWLPNWVRRDNDEFCDQVDAATSAECWVASGNYITRAQALLWGRAEMIIWLDLPLRITLPRITLRAWSRWRTKELLWDTNTESFAEHLAVWDPNRSLPAYAIKVHGRDRQTMLDAIPNPRWAHLRFVRLTSQRECDRFLASLIANASTEA